MSLFFAVSPLRRAAFVVLLALLVVVAAAPQAAAERLVSANPHAASLPSGTPPLAGIANLSSTDANAYHVTNQTEVNRALGYPDYNKPRILSDDSDNVDSEDAIGWITQVCGQRQNGERHYEHYDAALDDALYGHRATNGQTINTLSDFPQPSQDVLAHIKNSCASDLSTPGTLTQVGRKFYWNGSPVNLIGHSWMGAVAGKNFDINGYLSVLAAHDVNLTRVWVIEQWTALLINQAGAPHQSNAVMPFPGSIDFGGNNDSVNIMNVSNAFLTRLKTFVSTAASKGIVVQLTLFDRHGLLNKGTGTGKYGRWFGSPYNDNNNLNSILPAGSSGKAPTNFLTNCNLNYLQDPFQGGAAGLGVEEASLALLGPYPDCLIAESQRYLIERIVLELDAYGNVIYEIMNEPLAGEWGSTEITDWHNWVALTAKNASSSSPPTQ